MFRNRKYACSRMIWSENEIGAGKRYGDRLVRREEGGQQPGIVPEKRPFDLVRDDGVKRQEKGEKAEAELGHSDRIGSGFPCPWFPPRASWSGPRP